RVFIFPFDHCDLLLLCLRLFLLWFYIIYFFTYHFSFFLLLGRLPRSTLFPYTTLFRSRTGQGLEIAGDGVTWKVKDRVRSFANRSEEHTSELQSRFDLVCRLLLEKKKKKTHKNLLLTSILHILQESHNITRNTD